MLCYPPPANRWPPQRRLLAILSLGLALSAPAGAAQAKVPPQERTQELVAALQKHTSADAAADAAANERALDGLFDFARLAADPIAPHRRTLTATQLAQFTALFRDLIRYKALHAGTAFNEGTLHIGPPQAVGQRVKVAVHIANEEKDIDSHVTFSWEDDGQVWRVVDVDLDGASVVKDYQNQFGRILKKDGANGLIAKIRNRLDEARKTP